MASFSGISIQTTDAPVTVFISYSHHDAARKQEIEQFLEQYLAEKGQYVRFLSDADLRLAESWRKQLEQLWREAEVFLVLVSQQYLDSQSKDPELSFILRQVRENPGVRVLPIILEKCNWERSPIAVFQAIKPFDDLAAAAAAQQAAYQQIGNAVARIIYFLRNQVVVQIIEQEKKLRTGVLILSNLKLPLIPRDLLDMPWLRELYLDGNQIEQIENLGQLPNLFKLILSRNKLEKISGLKTLVSLQILDLEGNSIRQIEELNTNTELEVLDLSDNQLGSLEGLPMLPRLRVLRVAHNPLQHAKGLGGLPSLKRVVLTNTQIPSLRPLLDLLKRGLPIAWEDGADESTDGIFVRDNLQLSEPYPEVILQGREAVLKYFDDIDRFQRKKVRLEAVKLVLVGNSGVGKTNFSEFMRGLPLTPRHNSTHLLDIQRFRAEFLENKDGQPMLVNVFDFGGQDYYHDSHRLFFSYNTVYVLLWDQATNRYQANEAAPDGEATAIVHEDYPLEYWLESINYNLRDKSKPIEEPATPASTQPTDPTTLHPAGPARSLTDSAPVLILQNKIDQEEGWLDQARLRRCYPNIRGFFNVALQPKKRTSILLSVLGDYLRQMDFADRQLLDYEDTIVQHYLEEAEDPQQPLRVLELKKFRQECIRIIADESVNFTEGNARIIAQILHNLGVMYYDQQLSQVFTRVDRLNELIREIMLAAKASNGIFGFRAARRVARRYEAVLDLLLHNQSIIALPAQPTSTPQFLAPQLLPAASEPATQFFLKAFTGCQVRYVSRAYFHKTLLLPLFVKYVATGPAGTDWNIRNYPPFWRNGIVISREVVGKKPQMVLVELKQYGKRQTEAAQVSTELVGRLADTMAEKAVLSIRTIGNFDPNGLEREVVDWLDKELQHWAADKQVSVDGETFFSVRKLRKSVRNQLFEFSKKTKSQKDAEKQARKLDKTAKPSLPKVFNAHQFKHLVAFDSPPQKLFISYSSRNAEYIHHFVTQLKALKGKRSFTFWYDRNIKAGTSWDDTIQAELEKSDAAIFLLSPEFLATDYIMDVEVAQARKLHEDRQLKLFFVELQPCGWHHTSISRFQQLSDAAKREKNVISIGQPDNHSAWSRVVDVLEKDLFGDSPAQARLRRQPDSEVLAAAVSRRHTGFISAAEPARHRRRPGRRRG